jgi:hypothetical protein
MTSYADLKKAIQRKAVISFDQFFLFVTQKKFVADMGISHTRLRTIKIEPMYMTMAELDRLSGLLDISVGKLAVMFKEWYTVKQQ